MRKLTVCTISLLLVACSDSSKKTTPSLISTPTVQTGVFVDSPVAGVRYTTESNVEGSLTNENGEFNYLPGESVSFNIGGIELGQALGDRIITPLELLGTNDINDEVLNMAQLLQSLDSDDDPDTITISEESRAMFEGQALDFSDANFDQSLQAILDTSQSEEPVTVVDESEAQQHIEESFSGFAPENGVGFTLEQLSGTTFYFLDDSRDENSADEAASTSVLTLNADGSGAMSAYDASASMEITWQRKIDGRLLIEELTDDDPRHLFLTLNETVPEGLSVSWVEASGDPDEPPRPTWIYPFLPANSLSGTGLLYTDNRYLGYSINLTEKVASSVVIDSRCISYDTPAGFEYSFSDTTMMRVGSDSINADSSSCLTGAEETQSFVIGELAADFDLPFNCDTYPLCDYLDLNKTLLGTSGSENTTATYTHIPGSDTITYSVLYEPSNFTITETITLSEVPTGFAALDLAGQTYYVAYADQDQADLWVVERVSFDESGSNLDVEGDLGTYEIVDGVLIVNLTGEETEYVSLLEDLGNGHWTTCLGTDVASSTQCTGITIDHMFINEADAQSFAVEQNAANPAEQTGGFFDFTLAGQTFYNTYADDQNNNRWVSETINFAATGNGIDVNGVAGTYEITEGVLVVSLTDGDIEHIGLLEDLGGGHWTTCWGSSVATAAGCTGLSVEHLFDTQLAAESYVAEQNSGLGASIIGAWTHTADDNDLLAFVFFANGTYAHVEIDEAAPIDVADEVSGMEWGSFSRDSTSGQLTVSQTFDANLGTGLTDYAGTNLLFAQVLGDTLTLQVDDNQNGVIDQDESISFDRVIESGLTGSWIHTYDDNDLVALVFFDDGTYMHLEIDETPPINNEGETSGMEWGTYSRNADTGALTVTQTFDANGDTGLTDFVGIDGLFAQVSDDFLTLQTDDNGDGVIGAGETHPFDRNIGYAALLPGSYQASGGSDEFPTTFELNADQTGTWSYQEEGGDIVWSVNAEGQLFLDFVGGGTETYTLKAGNTRSGTIDIDFSDEPSQSGINWMSIDPETVPLEFTELELRDFEFYLTVAPGEDCGSLWVVEQMTFTSTGYSLDECGLGSGEELDQAYEVLPSGIVYLPGTNEYIKRMSFDEQMRAYLVCWESTELAASDCPVASQGYGFINLSDAQAYVSSQNSELSASGLSGTFRELSFSIGEDVSGDSQKDDKMRKSSISFGTDVYSLSGSEVQYTQSALAVNASGSFSESGGYFTLFDESAVATKSGYHRGGSGLYISTSVDGAGSEINLTAAIQNTSSTNSQNLLSGVYTKASFGGDSSGLTDITFDGLSSYSATGETLQYNVGAFPNSFSGSYTVDSTGVFELEDASGVAFNSGFVSEDGNLFIGANQIQFGEMPFMIAGIRNTSTTNTNGTLSGEYVRVILRVIGDNNGDEDVDYASGLADASFDGSGGFSIVGSELQNNQPTGTTNISGSYAVASDGKFTITPDSGQVLTEGIVSENGDYFVGAAPNIDGRLPFIVIGVRKN